MQIDKSLLKTFANITNDKKEQEPEKNLYGTISNSDDKNKFVKIDGSDSLTPISGIVDVKNGDRVLVSIENHKATIIGNFTFPPSRRESHEALDKAESAKEASNDAIRKAQDASQKSDTAISEALKTKKLADEAIEKSEAVKNIADAASSKAEEAKQKAENAVSKAESAKESSTQALDSIRNINTEITNINNKVIVANKNADKALENVEKQAKDIASVKETLSTEYTKKSETEEVKANLTTEITKKVGELETKVSKSYSSKNDVAAVEGRLQTQITQNSDSITSHASKINKVESDTKIAQEQVNKALENANIAKLKAEAAQSDANTAKSNADEAKSNADEAARKADEARQTADKAREKAELADKNLQEAKGDLEEAKQNLENVKSRIGATEQEIEDAKAKVTAAENQVKTAMEKAGDAHYAATKAQEAANKAQTDASTAQQSAENAKQKADAAAQSAENAKEKAEKAQSDVAALTSRVTKAETTITHNTESIKLNANKTEEIGNKLVNNYYSKTETDSKIEVESTKITNTVTNTTRTEIGKIKVGARNLLKDSNIKHETNDHFISKYLFGKELPVKNEVYTIQLKGSFGQGRTSFIFYSTEEKNLHLFDLISTDKNDSGIFTKTLVWEFDDISELYLYQGPDTVNMASKVEWIKFEKGNKATDWSPAPEDINNRVDVLKQDTNKSLTDVQTKTQKNQSKIEQLANQIINLITDENGSSMMTQTKNGWRFDISKITKNIDTLNNSVNDIEKGNKETTNNINKLNSMVNDISKKTAYINMTTDENGNPCIELGKSDNPFKVRITNTTIDFLENMNKLAYINNKAEYIEKAVIKNELKVGEKSGFVWRTRSNGNMGLRWEDK